MADRPTLLKPPQWDPNKAPIENVLDVTELAVLGPNIFTNTRQPWHPPGARGVYGGAVIAMCLAAGQRTVPDEFTVHSCHCYFILAGSADIPIMFHVEKVRDGRSFMTRTVQARQRGRAIFTTTMSFVREEAPATQVRHALPMPVDEDGRPLQPPADDWQPDESISTGPYESGGIKVVNRESPNAHEKKTRQWIRARGTIKGGHQAHLNALAYVSDSYFIGTISRIHRLWRFPFKVEEIDQLPKETLDHIQRLNDFEGGGMDLKSFGDRPQIGMMGLCRLKETPEKEGSEKTSKL
ncbi:putative acyl- thioesterase ii protein [Phaeoacremonium minimum UCRPA7]|uniref:Putative acyl-thioesterase ii protein n=1 Tax=Phaeoacremonium minimum (strain UCR-PA7) TaxID=1286976 RepID=R8B9G3_PHAM7|nr:putative acyl- thioesterase ii protein [Phaeoacremonium minimum UCRPA7]EON95927.1 putative acyl- thioesterase ii protein [Phaeoacremonium minimum UCRPA7]